MLASVGPLPFLTMLTQLRQKLADGVNRVFYYPDANDRGTPADSGLNYEDVYFSTSEGPRLHGWFLPATSPRVLGTVLHLHGNVANITGHYAFAEGLPPRGFNVLCFDYRGYGRSEGRPTRNGTIEDAAAALDYLRGRSDVDAVRIFLFGQSIGGTIGIALAARHTGSFCAVVIDSAFSGYRRIARYHVLHNPLLLVLAWWFPLLVSRQDDPIDCVSAIAPTPMFLMHGMSDRIVPHSMSQALFDAAGEPKRLWLIPDMDHTEVWWEQDEKAANRVAEFFESAISPQ